MTGTTLGGWPGIKTAKEQSVLVWITIPGTKKKVRLRKEVAPVFAAFLSEVHKHVIDLNKGPLDGWEYREARTRTGLSQHAGAVATDMRYDVLKADHGRHMTQTQINTMHALLNKYTTTSGKRVFGWGGDWQVGKFCDEMHLEAVQSWSPYSQGRNATVADFANVQKKLHIKSDGTFSVVGKVVNPVVKPVPAVAVKKPATPPAPVPVAVKSVSVKDFVLGKSNGSVVTVQKALAKEKHYGGAIDGVFGPATRAGYAHWQKALGYSGAQANGIPGVASLTVLGTKYKFKVVA